MSDLDYRLPDDVKQTLTENAAAHQASIERYEQILALLLEDIRANPSDREREKFAQEMTERFGGKIARFKLWITETQDMIARQ